MAKYLVPLTPMVLEQKLYESGIAWVRWPDRKHWGEFLTWSQLDPEKHESLVTLDEWQDEWAEFDACYEDWKEGQDN